MLVIGNGKSRVGVNLDLLHQEKIGCNAIFRDYYVEHLVCCDKRLVKQSIKHHSNIYTRSRWANDFAVNSLPELIEQGNDKKDEPMNWGSGPYAVLLASTMSSNIKMLGFDLYSETNYVNNMYSDSAGYSKSDSKPVEPSYWIYQIAKIFKWFPNTQYRIYNKSNWILPNMWNLPNVSLDTLDKL